VIVQEDIMKTACFALVLSMVLFAGCVEQRPVAIDKTSKPAPKPPIKVLELTDDSFPISVEKSKGVVLVDFTAPWCTYCRQMAPIVEGLASDFVGKIKVFKVDVDKSPKTAKRYSVTSLPKLVFFRDGKQIAAIDGAVDKDTLKKKMKDNSEAPIFSAWEDVVK
jgi:thioredoxin